MGLETEPALAADSLQGGDAGHGQVRIAQGLEHHGQNPPEHERVVCQPLPQ